MFLACDNYLFYFHTDVIITSKSCPCDDINFIYFKFTLDNYIIFGTTCELEIIVGGGGGVIPGDRLASNLKGHYNHNIT